MAFQRTQLQINGFIVEVVRKDIKHLRLAVYPPYGQILVSAPLAASDEAVRKAVISKLSWIKRQQTRIASIPRQLRSEMVTGETHFFLGQLYPLCVIERNGPRKVIINNHSLELYVRPGDTPQRRKELLLHWYRQQLRLLIPPLIEKWEPILGVSVAEWGIKQMKTRWGSCNIKARRIWINLELASKPDRCLEYIVVHEMLHLIERYHNGRFWALFDQYLPEWRKHQSELNSIMPR